MRKAQIMGVLLIITVLVLGACGPKTTTTPPPETIIVTPPAITVTVTPPATTVAPPPETITVTPPAITVTVTPPAITITVTPPAATVTVTLTPTPTQGANEVELQDNHFSPAFITVPVGATVTWTNVGGALHTVMSYTGLFDQEIAPGDSFSYTFAEPGRYGYHCHYHINNMMGIVTVE